MCKIGQTTLATYFTHILLANKRFLVQMIYYQTWQVDWSGFYHSLQVTAATHMYDIQSDEATIMSSIIQNIVFGITSICKNHHLSFIIILKWRLPKLNTMYFTQGVASRLRHFKTRIQPVEHRKFALIHVAVRYFVHLRYIKIVVHYYLGLHSVISGKP